MISEKNHAILIKIASYAFMVFLFLMPVFTTRGEGNRFFYLSLILMLVAWFIKREDFKRLIADIKVPLLCASLFLFYYSISNIWYGNPINTVSTLKHSVYLLFFLIMINHLVKKYGVLLLHCLIFCSVFSLFILTLIFVDKGTLLTHRLNFGFYAAPPNVIDLGGYFAIGIISALIIARETGRHWIYLPASLLFIGLLLTQSRGPLLALIVSAVILLFKFRHLHLKHVMYAITSFIIIGLFFVLTDYGQEYSQRLMNAYQQSFVRFGIWQYAIDVIQQKLWFGWGFEKEIAFKNSLGQSIRTTHSLYISSFLKGGIIGVMLLVGLIIAGLRSAWMRFHQSMALESMLYLFSLLFYVTQGMFVIGSPTEFWVLFWLPLGVVMASRAKVRQVNQPV